MGGRSVGPKPLVFISSEDLGRFQRDGILEIEFSDGSGSLDEDVRIAIEYFARFALVPTMVNYSEEIRVSDMGPYRVVVLRSR